MVGGLTFATIMVVLVPVFYVVIERLREGKRGRETGDPSPTPPGGEALMTAQPKSR